MTEPAHALLRRWIDAGTYVITPGSPWPSELAGVIEAAWRQQVGLLLEGGTFYGQTAAVLAAACPQARVWTVEIDPVPAKEARTRLAPFGARVHVIDGDAWTWLPRLAQEATVPLGIVLDGPKGTSALTLVQMLLENQRLTTLRMLAVHDTYPSTMGRPNPIACGLRDLADYTPGWHWWTTDDPEWAATPARTLDVSLYAAHRRLPWGWEPYQQHRQEGPVAMPCYGPTFTILERAP